ncbi:MAG: sodium:solute symporter family protein [Lachnospiraceae bacterium]|jgi:SSS family solute:Na+ symporter|nr:sodium:solute symporter family protein [Lachnospiraceae bacterium]
MNTFQILGIIITLAVFVGLSIYAGTRVKTAADFESGGGKTGALIVAGTIMGTLVGGTSTVGTAQLAYNYGMSAWWFTLGGGIGCLILAIGFVKPFRNANTATLVGMVSKEYGKTSGMLASVLSSIGIFINILSQLLSGVAAIFVIAPFLGTIPALIISALLMVAYVVLGGIKGAGMVGVLKLILLYFTVVFCAISILFITGGLSPLLADISKIDMHTGLFARGYGTDVGAALSLIFGVITTQTYGQALMAGKSDQTARAGALISAIMIPPVGICGILVGLYMRTQPIPEGFDSAKMALTAMTEFIANHVPSFLGGVMLATLIFAAVGTGAGLALGISTIINNDIIKKLSKKPADTKKDLLISRFLIIIVLSVAVVLAALLGKEAIQNFAYMSMGLRGAVMLIPLLMALFAKGKVDKKFIIASIVISPIVVLIIGIVPALKNAIPFDGLFIGIAISFVICMTGLVATKKH